MAQDWISGLASDDSMTWSGEIGGEIGRKKVTQHPLVQNQGEARASWAKPFSTTLKTMSKSDRGEMLW
jgi:hypothetical protein